jgi:beta-ureidopropionase
MKIALIQQHATKDKSDNLNRGINALKEAASNDADLIAFPELAFEFFLPQHPATQDVFSLAEPIPGPTTELFTQAVKELGVVVVLNLFERDNNRTYDTSPICFRNDC